MADETKTEETTSYIDRAAAEQAFKEGGTVMHEGRHYRSLDELPDDEASLAAKEADLAARKERAAKAKESTKTPAGKAEDKKK